MMSICESFGIPAIEAMSFGTPVIVSDCCSMPEVCGKAAELVPVDDVHALADRIEGVLLNFTKAEQLRRAGLDRVVVFNWENTASRMAIAVENMLRQPRTEEDCYDATRRTADLVN